MCWTTRDHVCHNSFPDPFLAPRPNPTNQRPRRVTSSESARLLCCVNPSRSSGHQFVQRCVPLNSGCLFVSKQTFTTCSTCRQSVTMFLICFRVRSPGPLDSGALCDPKRHLRPPSGDMASCSPQAFVHSPLSQVFRSHVSGIFDSWHFHEACHRFLYPQDLGERKGVKEKGRKKRSGKKV